MSYRFAIVGCGRIAQKHAECIARIGSLVATTDVIPERAAALAGKYNAKAYQSMDSMINEGRPDIVTICTPNGLHAFQSMLALSLGAHVLCEKPMAINSSDANAMCLAASENNRKLFIVKQNRFNPPVVALKALLDSNSLGEIHGFQVNCIWNRPASYFVGDWHGSLQLDGGTLYTQFSHFVDLICWFFGEAATATGFRSNQIHQNLLEFEDSGSVLLQMKNGILGNLHYTINSFRKNMEGSITVFGEKGTVKIGGEYLNKLEYFEVEGLDKPVLANGAYSNDYGTYQGSMSNHHLVYEELVKALQNKKSSLVDATEAIHSINMIELIYANSPIIPAR